MKNRLSRNHFAALALLLGFSLVFTLSATVYSQGAGSDTYKRADKGTRILEGNGGLAIKILVEQSNLGSGEVEVGEITFPADSKGGGHKHEAIEIFYVLSGRMNHIVNGDSHVIEPGMIAIVKPGDTVSHEVLDGKPVKALVIWAPGGEAERLAQFFSVKEIE